MQTLHGKRSTICGTIPAQHYLLLSTGDFYANKANIDKVMRLKASAPISMKLCVYTTGKAGTTVTVKRHGRDEREVYRRDLDWIGSREAEVMLLV